MKKTPRMDGMVMVSIQQDIELAKVFLTTYPNMSHEGSQQMQHKQDSKCRNSCYRLAVGGLGQQQELRQVGWELWRKS
jgi:hypothetical protein